MSQSTKLNFIIFQSKNFHVAILLLLFSFFTSWSEVLAIVEYELRFDIIVLVEVNFD